MTPQPFVARTASRTVTFDGTAIHVYGKNGRARWLLPFSNLAENVFKPAKTGLSVGTLELRPYQRTGAKAELVTFRPADQASFHPLVEAIWYQLGQRPAPPGGVLVGALGGGVNPRLMNRLLTAELWLTGLTLMPLALGALAVVAVIGVCAWKLIF